MSGPFLIGLTGSIGMGKSTASKMFRDFGIPVWDADAAVHRLYARGGAAVDAIGALRPEAIVDDAVSRPALKDWIAEDPTALPRIEAIVHPLVAKDRRQFIAACDADIAVLDVPLLYETGSPDAFDLVAVVSAPADVQRARVLERPGMTESHFEKILASQMPDADKRARADVVIPSLNMDDTRATIAQLINDIRKDRHA